MPGFEVRRFSLRRPWGRFILRTGNALQRTNNEGWRIYVLGTRGMFIIDIMLHGYAEAQTHCIKGFEIMEIVGGDETGELDSISDGPPTGGLFRLAHVVGRSSLSPRLAAQLTKGHDQLSADSFLQHHQPLGLVPNCAPQVGWPSHPIVQGKGAEGRWHQYTNVKVDLHFLCQSKQVVPKHMTEKPNVLSHEFWTQYLLQLGYTICVPGKRPGNQCKYPPFP